MRTLLLFLFTCNILFAKEYAIQLMSYKNPDSLTPGFMKLVERTGLKHEVLKQNGQNKIVIGRFKSWQEARDVCEKLTCIPDDAFVITLPSKVTVKEEVAVSEVQSSVQTCPPCKPCTVVCDPKRLRKLDMERAIEFYKNSDHYRFEMKTGY